ncbi:MAG TPA: MarR family winged helix-turn-helix transcriptional regulator [Solirubrobacterales bacterium]|nr:MarR family winged helix-turn-helix transcriptional regulator [Solirubrobacterales bacterium]
MTLWNEYGFRENPYSTKAIPPTEEGAELLVGREGAANRLHRLITSSETHPTIEGANGVGKTSLVQVTAYIAKRGAETNRTGQVFLPLDDVFQITPATAPGSFRQSVYYAVVRAFAHHYDTLKAAGLSVPDYGGLHAWLKSPLFHGTGVSLPGGAGVNRSGTPNDARGFAEDGFAATVNEWLSECFPSSQAGGFVCVLDNLELLETSHSARTFLEMLRDSLLNVPGLKWVLCGARGIVRSAAASPRLNGILGDPMELGPIASSDVPEVVGRRIDCYAMSEDFFLPVDEKGFKFIYEALNHNLRDALKQCEAFSFWLDEKSHLPTSPQARLRLLDDWLALQAGKFQEAARSVRPRAWKVFNDLIEMGGSCSPGDHESFGFNTPMAMRPHVKDLEDANLVLSTVDDRDQRRRTISLTSSGWLLHHARTS